MGAKTKFYIVAASALPDIFIKVAEAKRMMQTGECATVGDATRRVGISRSAFYKYKDAVQPFNNMKTGHIITFYAMLKDNPGVLSNVLAIFAGSGANILTINQTIPTNGCAAVTISAETSEMEISLEELITRAAGLTGVVKFEILAG
ncbi:MAG: ACT domain-containing protein [Oscillibacter sp.]|nr:ACT domain-containing protein [Oscillibacter sp.]